MHYNTFQSNKKFPLEIYWILTVLLAAIMRSRDFPVMSDKINCMINQLKTYWMKIKLLKENKFFEWK